MKGIKHISEHVSILIYQFRLAVIVMPIALATGCAVALFLWLLDVVTQIRWANPWLLFLLPLAGVGITFVYTKFGGRSGKGNNLIIDEIHTPGGGVPRRMAPLVFFGTLVTHLFGGSAGREGTAVQMGGSLAAMFGKWFGLGHENMGIALMAGIAAGFGAVFGTPLTGTIFAMEVLAIGRLKYDALLPCLVAAVVGDASCAAWGIHHTKYHIAVSQGMAYSPTAFLHLDVLLLLKVIGAGIAFGLSSFLFAEITHRFKYLFQKWIKLPWLIPVVGGAIIILLAYLLGTRDYLGLGVNANTPHAITIVSAFSVGGAGALSWFWKILFTAITLSCGFKGGEVTPLFFIGAALGNALAVLFGAPVDLFAGLGFIAVFAGATNTPLACTIMGVELFGGEHLIYYAVACFIAYFCSGHSGIYAAQQIAVPKNTGSYISGETNLGQSFSRRGKFSQNFLLQWWRGFKDKKGGVGTK